MVAEGVRSRLQALVNPVVQSSGAFLVDLKVRGDQGSRVVEVFVDTDEGVSTDLCAEISREISRRLDREGVILGRYNLVVSSPGLDRPLKLLRQYRRHIGRILTVRFTAEEVTRNVEGELEAVSDEWIVLRKPVEVATRPDKTDSLGGVETLRIPLQSISEAKAKISW